MQQKTSTILPWPQRWSRPKTPLTHPGLPRECCPCKIGRDQLIVSPNGRRQRQSYAIIACGTGRSQEAGKRTQIQERKTVICHHRPCAAAEITPGYGTTGQPMMLSVALGQGAGSASGHPMPTCAPCPRLLSWNRATHIFPAARRFRVSALRRPRSFDTAKPACYVFFSPQTDSSRAFAP